MTVSELIEQLEDFDPDTEVRLGTQPAWPMQFGVAGVVHTSQLDAELVEHLAGDPNAEVVWILEGYVVASQVYGHKDWWNLV